MIQPKQEKQCLILTEKKEPLKAISKETTIWKYKYDGIEAGQVGPAEKVLNPHVVCVFETSDSPSDIIDENPNWIRSLWDWSTSWSLTWKIGPA